MAIKLDEGNEKTYLSLLGIYIRQGKFDMAKELLQYIEEQPTNETFQAAIKEQTTNSYGSTIFELRYDYMSFDALPENVQSTLSALMFATIAEDESEIIDIVSGISGQYWLKSKVDGYKVNLGLYAGGVNLEMRPENGYGYYVRYDADGTYYERYVCPCLNWQWDGEFQGYTRSYRGTVEFGNADMHFVRENFQLELWKNGKIETGLRNGDVSETAIITYLENGIEVSDQEISITHYDNGHPVSVNGSAFTDEEYKNSYVSLLEDVSMQDEIYW